MTPTLIRRCAVLMLAAALPVLVAAPAGAEVPEGWSDPAPVSILEMLVLILGIPLVLVVLISLAVVAPALARGEQLLPSSGTENQWFGGPRPSRELESGRTVGPTGGASGRW